MSFGELRVGAGGLTSATASRLLQVLQEEEWVEHGGDGRYRIAAAGYRFASQIAATDTFDTDIQRAVDALAVSCQHSAAFTEWADAGFRFRYKKEISGSYPYLAIGQIGRNVFHNGFGIMRAAHQDEETLELICRQHDQHFAGGRKRLREIASQSVWITSDIGVRIVAPVQVGSRFLGVLGLSCPLAAVDNSQAADFSEKLQQIITDLVEQLHG